MIGSGPAPETITALCAAITIQLLTPYASNEWNPYPNPNPIAVIHHIYIVHGEIVRIPTLTKGEIPHSLYKRLGLSPALLSREFRLTDNFQIT